MLKSCWDCISGSGGYREREENDVSYGTLLNGNTQRAPPWPQPQSENDTMFLLPRPLNSGDRVEISGIMRSSPNMLTAALLTEANYENIRTSVDVNFRENQIAINVAVIQNGRETIENLNMENYSVEEFFRDSDFRFTFAFNIHEENNNRHFLTMFINEAHLQVIELKNRIQDIRCIMLSGDVEKVEKLDFIFA